MNHRKCLRCLALLLIATLSHLSGAYAVSLWVGETTTLRTSKITMTGYEEVITTGFYWSLPSSSKGYISITTQAGSGASTNMIRLDKFFTGEKYVTCKISYYGIRYFLTGGYQQSETRTTVQTFVVKCNTVGVSLYPEEMELNIGESKALQYKFSPATSQPAATVSFSSSNPKVAEVDFVGNVHAVGVGEATITAKTNFETTATCQVKVNPVLATTIALDHDEMALFVGEKASLTATVLPGNTTNKSIQWTSDNDDVVQVSQKGELTAVGTGRAQVSASTRDGSKLTAHCNITVSALAESLTLDVGEKTIGIGEAFMLTARVAPEGASPRLTWKSSAPTVAYVDGNGRVEGFKTGTATITATTTDGTDLSDTCRVTVIRYVSSIELNEDEITLLAGETKKLTATVNPTDATHRSLSWTSTAPDVATVDDGTVTARSNGSATIVAASTDGSHIQAVCRVTVKTPVSSILLSETELEMRPGDFKVLNATVMPESASDKTLTWTSSAPDVADVQNGIVLAYSNGNADITATAADGSGTTATCKVTVTNTVGIDDLSVRPQVAAKGNVIVVSGIPSGSVCKIFRSNGTEVYRGKGRNGHLTYTTSDEDIYIVHIGRRTYKLLVGSR